MSSLSLFNESCIPKIEKDISKEYSVGNLLAIMSVIICVLFLWYKYNQKQRRLIIEAQAQRIQNAKKQESINNLQGIPLPPEPQMQLHPAQHPQLNPAQHPQIHPSPHPQMHPAQHQQMHPALHPQMQPHYNKTESKLFPQKKKRLQPLPTSMRFH